MKHLGTITLVSALALLGLGSTAAHAESIDATADLPPSAKPGMCYARVLIPANYTTETAQVLRKEASSRIEIIPSQFEWLEEQVLVKEASTKLEIVPAKYEWVEERVMVKPATTQLVEVPAKYEWVEEKVLVKPTQTVWKKGRGPIEKVDNATGEIMCFVEEPAVYQTVRKRVLKEKAKTVKTEVPAEYKTVKRQTVVQPTTTREFSIPAQHETVQVRKLVSPDQERIIEIPAEYETVSKKKLVSPSKLVWEPVLCQTNMQKDVVITLQRGLADAGHSPGPIDGVIGSQTMEAVRSYQRAKGLATGGLTLETLNSLNVRFN